MKSTWKDTKKLYKEYIDVDPTIDYKDPGVEDKGLLKLANLFGPVDQRLDLMLRGLSGQDKLPEPAWCQEFLERYPWLSGIAIIGTSGEVIFQTASYSLKPFDYAGFSEFEERFKERNLAALVASDEVSTELFVGMPYFENNTWSGTVVAYFDVRNLATFSPDPSQLFIIYPDGVLWAGDNETVAQAIVDSKWEQRLDEDVQGAIGINGVPYVWAAKFIGQLEIVYLVPADKPLDTADSETDAAPEEQTEEQ
ncbi:hypothetical protein [Desulfovibrio inopinatus]|uniref:hypothetical protein n=1 Tax=Desulfovibrio inopinatus TaxID=102109 RepID=UPI0012EC2723|nr:hypothetical protein [Desulfovibrio inopinatus]